ncbi:isocitrate lyase/PEP mutase family protein [Antarcticimicrobium luteum]|uniref:Isocitrate lyase/PEP mutase family protein n=1 Tax=Antarcticimicrobium luteum TaxID=2547397 RepID=A0A4R5V9R2_9RHOB|nr:isocitrate lyase/PEP mutase family protein [Antarcticimicrobium luteum]TDK48694.1 isocitrate lyase/PEP mutase family protein [Antarcticimicrobium luteum]
MTRSQPDKLRALLARPGLITMPCCFDPLSAKLIEQEGFALTFMSGFASAAARLGAPDTGLMSYAEVLDQGRNICNAVSVPVIGDGDTGYGNAMNVKRTVKGFAQAGFAAVMIEDQVAPKRCGHTAGKSVVTRDEAFERIRAAADARAEGHDILILARTDARHEHGLDEAIARAREFRRLGADILFVEAPRDEGEMRRVCSELEGPKMANIVEGGLTPALAPKELEAMGFKIAAYPLTVMAAAMKAMVAALDAFKTGTPPAELLMPFDEMKTRIGFDAYFDEEKRYAVDRTG